MTLQLRIIIFILLILALVLFFHRIKNQKLALQYSLSWLMLIVILFIVVLFPKSLNVITEVLGIELPINMVFFLGFVFTLLIIYDLTVAVSKMSNEIKDLTQKIALMEKQLHDDEKGNCNEK